MSKEFERKSDHNGLFNLNIMDCYVFKFFILLCLKYIYHRYIFCLIYFNTLPCFMQYHITVSCLTWVCIFSIISVYAVEFYPVVPTNTTSCNAAYTSQKNSCR